MNPFLVGHGEIRLSSARSNSSKWIIAQQPHGQVFLFTAAGEFKRELPHEVRSDTQPVFSRTSPDHIFTVNENQIWMRSLIDDNAEVVASFPQYVTLTPAHAEGDLTPDGWLALCGVDEDAEEHAFCYNLHTGETGGVRQVFSPIDGLKAAIGGWLIVSGDFGIEAYPRSGGSHRVVPANGHACTAGRGGRPVLVWCNSDDPQYNDNAAMLINIEDPTQRKALKSFDWRYAMHVSDEYVSVYDKTGELPFQIWHTPFDGAEPELLYEWEGPYNALYQPRASYSDGLLPFNRWNGQECNVWALPIHQPSPDWRPVDYSSREGYEYNFRHKVIGGRLTLLDVLEKAP